MSHCQRNSEALMIRITEVLAAGSASMLPPRAQLSLPFEQRRKSRLRSRLEGGEEVGLFLPRGTALRDGDLLRADNGWVVRINAAPETVSVARSNDPLALARASYHLGNRHIALQVTSDGVRYLHDHVLDEMVRALGLTVTKEDLPFEPEAGAYGGFGRHDDHGHTHGDIRSHDHGHAHPHGHEH
jgi:urease accessory protein